MIHDYIFDVDGTLTPSRGTIDPEFKKFFLKFAKTMNEFVNYVYDFYGKNGIYDMGATRDNITTATIDYLASDDSLPFYGDSLDRERVRDFVINRRAL